MPDKTYINESIHIFKQKMHIKNECTKSQDTSATKVCNRVWRNRGFDGVYFRVVLDFNSIIKWWFRWAKNKTSELTIRLTMEFSIIRITVKSYIIVAQLNRKWNLTEYINITLSIHHYSSIQWTTQSWQTRRSSVTWPLHHKKKYLLLLIYLTYT